jgi:hypothetical protein
VEPLLRSRFRYFAGASELKNYIMLRKNTAWTSPDGSRYVGIKDLMILTIAINVISAKVTT